MRNWLVSFEGGEGTGKTTQIRHLEALLIEKGFQVRVSWEPGSTELGERLRTLLADPSLKNLSSRAEAFLFAASRAQHVDEVLKPELEKGKVVLCDRYVDASLAYQGWARGLGMERVWNLNLWAMQGLLPKRTYFFDLDPRIGMARVNERQKGKLERIELESMAFHDRIRSAYQYLTAKYPDRFLLIDASQPPEEVSKILEKDLFNYVLV